MQLSDQCTSLSLSQELKKQGVRQDSQFRWAKFSLNPEAQLFFDPTGEMLCLSGELEWKYSAFLASELGEMLPVWIKNPHRQMLKIWKCANARGNEKWACWYEDDFTYPKEDYTPKEDAIWANTMVEAMGQMILFLITNKLIGV